MSARARTHVRIRLACKRRMHSMQKSIQRFDLRVAREECIPNSLHSLLVLPCSYRGKEKMPGGFQVHATHGLPSVARMTGASTCRRLQITDHHRQAPIPSMVSQVRIATNSYPENTLLMRRCQVLRVYVVNQSRWQMWRSRLGERELESCLNATVLLMVAGECADTQQAPRPCLDETPLAKLCSLAVQKPSSRIFSRCRRPTGRERCVRATNSFTSMAMTFEVWTWRR